MLSLLLACTLGAPDTPPPAAPVHPMVALITIDTWRADHFTADLTPNLWALAQEGERYTRAYAPMGLTTPSHATMLTGLMPWEHGVEGNNHHGYALAKGVPVLPEAYGDWARGAFVSAYPAGPVGGLERGWEVFDGPSAGERAGEETVRLALDWLPDDRPALLWVHVYEPHGPYVGRGATERERYAEEVTRADTALAPLLQVLKQRNARIVVTSDHGEALDEERCSYQHERSISEHVLKVPLFRWGEGIAPAVIEHRVSVAGVRALLSGESISAQPYTLAESGMCEPDCAPGCTPEGLMGRDRVAVDDGGRFIERPGVGRMTEGQPAAEAGTALDAIPAMTEPGAAATEGARSLGYTE